jgi:dienelactone hydrolase
MGMARTPAVVMAHGFAGVKAGGLEPFAERFCREGFTAVAFDYRHWGGSSGEPREVTSIQRQREDYRTAINWAAASPDIDAKRIFIWGTSFSGMHVVEIATTDVRLRGAIAQCRWLTGSLARKYTSHTTATSALGRFARSARCGGRTPADLHHRERSGWRIRRNR